MKTGQTYKPKYKFCIGQTDMRFNMRTIYGCYREYKTR